MMNVTRWFEDGEHLVEELIGAGFLKISSTTGAFIVGR